VQRFRVLTSILRCSVALGRVWWWAQNWAQSAARTQLSLHPIRLVYTLSVPDSSRLNYTQHCTSLPSPGQFIGKHYIGISVSSPPISVSNRSQIFVPVVTNLVFVLVPFRSLRFPECFGDFPVQFVEVDHAVAHLCQSILQPLALGLSMLFSAPTIEA
jgi:hypothetical protein